VTKKKVHFAEIDELFCTTRSNLLNELTKSFLRWFLSSLGYFWGARQGKFSTNWY